MSAVILTVSGLALHWKSEAVRRRTMSAHDVTADILEHCAQSLLKALESASADDEELSPADFGALPHVNKSSSQVRRWCQENRIAHRRVGRDYRIRRGEAVPMFTITSAASVAS